MANPPDAGGSTQGKPYGPNFNWSGTPVTDAPMDDEEESGSDVDPAESLVPGAKLSVPMQKRRRVTRACDECRRKKIKCDGKQPCTHCTVYSYGMYKYTVQVDSRLLQRRQS